MPAEVLEVAETTPLLPRDEQVEDDGELGFFKLKFAGSPYADNFQNYFSIAFMGTNLLVVGSAILIQKQTDYQVDSTTYFYFVMSMLSLSAISTSIVQNGMFGLASKFTGFHVQGVMVGQGLAGAGVAISQIVSQILSPPKRGELYSYTVDPTLRTELMGSDRGGHHRRSEGLEHSAFLFFSFALCFTVISVLAQALLVRLPIYEYYTEDQPRQPIEFLAPPCPPPSEPAPSTNISDNGITVPNANDNRRSSIASANSNITTATVTPAMVAEVNRRHAEEDAAHEEAERVNHFRSTSLGAIVLATDDSAMQLMQDIYPKRKAHPLVVLYVSITLVFALTLSLFPSLTGLVESTNTEEHRSRLTGDLFVPFHFLMYNIGDWAGKALPSIVWFAPNTTHPTRRQQLRYLFSALGRFIFIPIFLTSNLPIPADKRLFPLLIHRDEVWFFLVFLFALSNGYLGSIVMMVGPSCVLGGEKKARAGVRLGFWLTTGLALGSVASFGVRKLMCARGGCSS
ncbi:hypothetical protein BGX34_005738 [Mortierella sp. NVP85]|nr:hypothetical protein BGX34_005738 [Mortierella sp. NVP85]